MIPDLSRYDLKNEAVAWHFDAVRPFVGPPSRGATNQRPAAVTGGDRLPVAAGAADALRVLPVEGTVWMRGNSDVEDGRFFGELVVRLVAPVGSVRLTSIDLSCVNERGLWAWSQDQRAFVDGGQGRTTVGLVSYTNLARAQEVDRGGCLLSIERAFKPRLPMQYPYEWDSEGTCFVLDVQWIAEDGEQRKQRHCFVWQAARSIEVAAAPPGPPRLARAELLRLQEQGFLAPHERELLESVDDEERYLLFCHPDHYQGRHRAQGGPPYDALLRILSELRERLAGHPLPPLAPPGRAHRAAFSVPARRTDFTLPMSPSRPETLRVTSHDMELSFALEGTVVRIEDALSFDVAIVVTWIE